jgi:hypothetical protein
LKHESNSKSSKIILNIGDTFYEEAVTLASYIEDNKRKSKNFKQGSVESIDEKAVNWKKSPRTLLKIC